MSDIASVLGRITDSLGRAGIPFMVAGSFASTTHGLPRSTQDLDLVIEPPGLAAIHALVRSLPKDQYYVDEDAASDAYARRGMFNVIDQTTGWKIDLIIRKERPFSSLEFSRRTPIVLAGVPVFVATAEDTVVAKLEWSDLAGGSERQRRDIAGILASLGEQLDRAYVEKWVRELGLEREWLLAQRASP
jgi:hypothetical protein